MTSILVVRAEPGASATVERARMLGLDPLAAPIFEVEAVDWTPPDLAGFDAIMLTSGHAARLAGEGRRPFLGLPCFAIGESTAAGAREAGFANVMTGDGGAVALAALMAKEGVARALHLCGREHQPLDAPFDIVRRIVYAVDEIAPLPNAAKKALNDGAIALLHSPRSARHFGALVDDAGLPRAGIRVAAISDAALRAAGEGWRDEVAAAKPRDEALLELAAKLCKTAGGDTGRGG